MLTRKKALVAVPETSYGEAPAIDTGTMMLVTELTRTPYQGNTVERTRMRDNLGGYAQINTGPNTQVQVTVALSGSGTAPTETEVVPPALGILLRACGMAEIQDLTEGEVIYRPTSEEGESVTLYYLNDGQQQIVTGCRGTVTWTTTTAGLPALQFTFTGLYQRPTAIAPVTLTPANQADEIPVNYQNTTMLTFHGYEARGQSFSFDIGNTVTYRNLINYEGVHITDRASTGQIAFEAPRVDVFDVFELTESHQVVSTGPVVMEHGTVTGNIVGFRSPKTQLTGIAEQDSDGFVHYQTDARHLPVDGDDEFEIYFK